MTATSKRDFDIESIENAEGISAKVAISEDDLTTMVENSAQATNLLKAISHEGRLMILCHLATGEKSVTELEHLISVRQAAVSQQLSRLRLEGLVAPRRHGKAIYYSLSDDRARMIVNMLCSLFCKQI